MTPGLVRSVLLAVAVRAFLIGAAFGVVRDPSAFLTADSSVYLDLGRSITHGAYEVNGVPHIRRPPAYPTLLAVGTWLGQPVFFALIAQVLLGALTVLLAHRITTRLYGERAASGASLLCAVEPVMLVWTATVMAETLLTFFVTGAVYSLVRYRDRPTLGPVAAAALSAAAAALTKPIAGALPLMLAALIPWMSGLPLWHRIRHALALLVLSLPLMAAWTLRNNAVADLATFSSQIEGTLAFSAPAAVIAAREGRPFTEVRQERGAHEGSNAEDLRRLRAEGMDVLLASPREFAWVHFSGVLRTLLNPGALPYLSLFRRVPAAGPGAPGQTVLDYGLLAGFTQMLRGPSVVLWTTIALAAVTLIYLALATMGGLGPDRAVFFLAPFLLYFLVLSGGPWGQSRFRHPVMPIICVFAGRALSRNHQMRPDRTVLSRVLHQEQEIR